MSQSFTSTRYNYPYENTANESNVRIQSGFDIQKAIDKTKGTIIEVGGPSPDGFYFLQGCTFPRKPIITNLNYKASVMKEFRPLYTPYIEKTLDIRKNLLKSGSVGVCLASCLNVIASEPRPGNKKAWDKAWEQLDIEDKILRSNPKAQPKVGLRFILLKNAQEFLEKGGLLIVEALREAELKYALAIGFSLRATSKPYKQDNENVYQSIVLQK